MFLDASPCPKKPRLVKNLLEELGSLEAAIAELKAIALATENRYDSALNQTRNGMRVDVCEKELQSDRSRYTAIARTKIYPKLTALAREIQTVNGAILDLSNVD